MRDGQPEAEVTEVGIHPKTSVIAAATSGIRIA